MVDTRPRRHWFQIESPIAVFGGFAALVEVALILAIIFVDGVARWALIVFAAVVFLYVSTWFFWILTHKNWVLYPPKDYGGETGVTTYVEAMSYQASERRFNGGALGPHDASQDMSAAISLQRSVSTYTKLTNPAFEISGPIQYSYQFYFLVFMEPLSESSLGLRVEEGACDNIYDCLKFIACNLLPTRLAEENLDGTDLQYMNYGTSWILRDITTGRDLSDIGPQWSWKQNGSHQDVRHIDALNISAGSHLGLRQLLRAPLPISSLDFGERGHRAT